MSAADWASLIAEGYEFLHAGLEEEALKRFGLALDDLGPCDTVTHSDYISLKRLYPRFDDDLSALKKRLGR